ncbi:MAG: MFS transporter [Nocardioidaceae bacterium]
MKWGEAFAPLKERNFAWYFWSRFVNTAGGMMAGVALAFAVLAITDNSASALGKVLAARTIPLVIFLLFGGVIADRLPRTLILQVSNTFSALSQGAVAYLVISGHAELWMIICLEAFNGTVSAVSFPAMTSMMPQLVRRDQLQPANALMSLSRGGLTILGPTISALLVVTVGPGWALAIDAASWLAAALLLLPVKIPPREPAGPGQQKTMIGDLREGWTIFSQTTWLWAVVLAFGLLNMISTGALNTLGPAVANNTIGKQGWGFVLSAESAGLLLTTVVLLRFSLQRPLLFGMLACSLMGLPMILLGAAPHLMLLVIASFIAGAGIEVFSMGWNLAMQENIAEEMLSRAYSYDALGSFVAMPIGQLLYGPLGASFGYEKTLVFSGIAYFLIAFGTVGSRSVRDLRRVPVIRDVVPTEP